MNRGAWVSAAGGRTYVWPRGEVVYVYGAVEYARRLAGEVTDAQPYRAVPVSRFATFEAFRAWCRIEGEPRTLPPALPRSPTNRKSCSTGISEPPEKG